MATREDRRPWEVVLKEWQLRCIYERIYSHNPSLRRDESLIIPLTQCLTIPVIAWIRD